MVRLKERKDGVRPEFNIVSIPYGTIKSLMPSQWESNLDRVSIPYGTIKSVYQEINADNTTLFQFLMVRLKECLHSKNIIEVYSFNSLWYD